METTMYDENSRTSVKKMKLEMSLDLQAGDQMKMKQERFSEVLGSPELGFFMLSSPDLEKILLQQNGMILTTPTPTTQILFPKSVTEEQEAYARGFVDALGELHKNFGKPLVNQTHPSTISTTALDLSPQGDLKAETMAEPITQQTIITQVPPAAVYTTLRTSHPSTRASNQRIVIQSFQPKVEHNQPKAHIFVQPKMEANLQRIQISATQKRSNQSFQPKVESSQQRAQTAAKSSQFLDFDTQDDARMERKRARNRLAATRCRNRKLERISRLEERVQELKSENEELADTAAALREQVYRLKESIIEHTSRGCQVVINHELL